ncbi:MAG: CHAD domain-containing protein [Deltaproteobacteria bacterium]|nr:CHAD domain-containing protein [Deltaproteobacteria bacterium]
MKQPNNMLTLTPEEATRRISLALLSEAKAASARLSDPDDAEALHDMRVAIRRLRSTAGAYRTELGGPMPKKVRRALRALQNATGGSRDAEVALEWLLPQRAGLNANHRMGFDALLESLAQEKAEGYDRARKEVRADFKRLHKKLYPDLEKMVVEIHLDAAAPPRTWAEELAVQLRKAMAEVVTQLSSAGPAPGPGRVATEVHDARIAMKRLRYLLEPVRPLVPAAGALVKECKGLQDLLGEINDSEVLLGKLSSAMESAAKNRAARLHKLALADDDERIRAEMRITERPGFDEIQRRLEERSDGLMGEVERKWLDSGLDRFASHVHSFADRLEALAERNVEIERKFLLRYVPDEALEHRGKTIEQGWLPGNRLRERLRRIDGPSGTKYVRTVKTGEGIERFELEEETSSELFRALWPLTEGCRVEKRRYDVPDGDLVWEIDEFTDRELFLAEVELPTRDTEAEIPGWLADAIVEEVTGDPDYVNLNLAK